MNKGRIVLVDHPFLMPLSSPQGILESDFEYHLDWQQVRNIAGNLNEGFWAEGSKIGVNPRICPCAVFPFWAPDQQGRSRSMEIGSPQRRRRKASGPRRVCCYKSEERFLSPAFIFLAVPFRRDLLCGTIYTPLIRKARGPRVPKERVHRLEQEKVRIV